MGEAMSKTNWRNRVKALEYHVAGDIQDHPHQWRTHPAKQAEALRDVLDEVGVAGAMLVYASERAGGALVRIDGHGRKDLDPRATWPCLVLDVDDREADLLLATYDPISAQASADAAKLDELLRGVSTGSAALQSLLSEVAERAGLVGDESAGGGTMTGAVSVARPSLSDRFIVPPFSVLDARQGYWQERKRAWIAMGIQSELGRGVAITPGDSDAMMDESLNFYRKQNGLLGEAEQARSHYKANATPGGAPLPAARLGDDGRTIRGDGRGRPMKNGKGPARTFGQDLMRGEHTVGENRLTWVAGDRPREALDETSRKILAAGRKMARPPHGATVTQNPDGSLADRPTNNGEGQSGTSIFDPVLCELAYRWFCPTDGAVLDPFAGGSVRGIVAAKLGRAYTGIDLRPEQIEANQEQAREIVPERIPTWIEGDSRYIATLAPGAYDLIFSCPPYADLEVYSDDPRDLSTLDYADFLTAYREIVAASVAMLKADRFACFVVGDIRDKRGFYRNFVSDTIAAFQDAGALLYNEAVLVTAVGSLPIRVGRQFEACRKLGKTHQNVLVFLKGDARKAVEACGPVEAVLPDALQSADEIGAGRDA